MLIENVNDCYRHIYSVIINGNTMKNAFNLIENTINIFQTKAMRRSKRSVGQQSLSDSNKKNVCLITIGDYGFKDKKIDVIRKHLDELNGKLSQKDCFVYMIRNCNDDPSLFNDNIFSFSNIKLLPDVSLLVSKEIGNILCVGGGVSYNKKWKEAFFKSTQKQLFFENEITSFDEDELNECLSKIKINFVLSFSCPSFCYPSDLENQEIIKWDKDNENKKYFRSEKIIMDKIYGMLLVHDNMPSKWVYGAAIALNHSIHQVYGEIIFLSNHDPYRLTAKKEEQTDSQVKSIFDKISEYDLQAFEPLHTAELRAFDRYLNDANAFGGIDMPNELNF